MAQNYISRGEVITVIAPQPLQSGKPYRLFGFNGIALLTTASEEICSFQLEGVFELDLPSIDIGDLIIIDEDNQLKRVNAADPIIASCIFGRAVTSSYPNGKFYCRLLQSCS